MRVHIDFETIEDLKKKFLEGTTIIQKMRIYRQRFEANHDADSKKLMKEWEAKADKYLTTLKLSEEE